MMGHLFVTFMAVAGVGSTVFLSLVTYVCMADLFDGETYYTGPKDVALDVGVTAGVVALWVACAFVTRTFAVAALS